MIYRITYDNKSRKLAHPVKNREELMALRNSQQNLDNLNKARQGDEKAKADLLQLAYNLGHVEGLKVRVVSSFTMWIATMRSSRMPLRN